MMSVVVSVRVKRELKEEAERLGIDLRRLVEETLKKEVERRRRARFEEAIDTIVQGMNAVSEEEFVKVVREWRRKRV